MLRLEALCGLLGSFDLGGGVRADRLKAGDTFVADAANAARLIRRGQAIPAPEPVKEPKRKRKGG
jgi:hypothetical protein|tara:strand:+ start:340 stop:534 length:195 start_codon:yes stop_codon:yes gene_type:complete